MKTGLCLSSPEGAGEELDCVILPSRQNDWGRKTISRGHGILRVVEHVIY